MAKAYYTGSGYGQPGSSVYTQDPNTGVYVQQQGPVAGLSPSDYAPVPSGGATIPLGGNFNAGGIPLVNQGGNFAPQTGNTSSLGQNAPTVSSPFNSSASMGIYGNMINSLQGAMTGNQALLQGQQTNINQQYSAAQAQLQALQQSGHAQFDQQTANTQQAEQNSLGMSDVQAAIADPTGTYSAPGGGGGYASTAYQGIKADITNQFQETLNNISTAKAGFDAEINSQNLQAAAQAGSLGLQAAQNALNNNLGLMNSMFSTIENQQNYGLNVASFNQQAQYQQQQTQIQQANALLPQIAGSGWKNLSPQMQSAAADMMSKLGLPPGMAQIISNNNQVKNSFVTADPLGNQTIVNQDGNGNIISQHAIGGGISPGSYQGQQILGSYVNFGNGGTGKTGYITPSMLSGSGLKSSAILEAMGAAGKNVKVISTQNATVMDNGNQAIAGLNDMVSTFNTVANDLAKNSGQEVSGFIQRNADQILNDPRISAWASQNSELIAAIKASTGLTGGIGLTAVLGKTGALIDTNSNVQTIMQNAQNLAKGISAKMDSVVPGYMDVKTQFPDLVSHTDSSGGANLFGSAIGGGTGTGSSGSTWTSPSGQTYHL